MKKEQDLNYIREKYNQLRGVSLLVRGYHKRGRCCDKIALNIHAQ
jgi:hypothetical protein